MAEDITLLIPTQHRAAYLDRILDYYSDTGIPIVVCDSSEAQNHSVGKYENVKYTYYGEVDLYTKIGKGLDQINTNYVAICADDDFIVPDTIVKCTCFLDENPDYSSVQGLTIVFENDRKCSYFPYSLPTVGLDVDDELASSRIRRMMVPYIVPLSYAIHRSESLKGIFHSPIVGFTNETYVIFEFLTLIISLINGKHKVLDLFYSAREYIPVKTKYNDFSTVLQSYSKSETYTSFLEVITKTLAEQEKMDMERARALIEDIFSLFLHESSQKNPLPAIATAPLRRVGAGSIKRIIPFLSTVKRIYVSLVWSFVRSKSLREQRALINQTTGIEGYPTSDSVAKREWEQIKKIIAKHRSFIHG